MGQGDVVSTCSNPAADGTLAQEFDPRRPLPASDRALLRRAEQRTFGKLGLTLAPAVRVAGAGSEGVVVTGVDSSGAAAERGFATGDVILEVAGKSVSTPADIRKAIADVRTDGKRTVLMRVKKGENTRFVALPVGNG